MEIVAGEPVPCWLVLMWNAEIEANVLGGPYPSIELATATCQDLVDEGRNAAIIGPVPMIMLG